MFCERSLAYYKYLGFNNRVEGDCGVRKVSLISYL